MDIRFYDFEFNLLYIEQEIISADWYIKYNGIGTFEGHFSANGDKLKILLENQYTVAVQGDLQAVITAKQVADGELVLYGRTVNWLLGKRVTPAFSTRTSDIGTNAETIVRKIVADAFSDVDNFILADEIGIDFEKHFWRNVYHPTSEVVKDCLDNADCGHRLIFDRSKKSWVFEIYKGNDLDILISVGSKTADSQTYCDDFQDYLSEGWYEKITDGGEIGEIGEWNLITLDEEKNGIYRWEGVLSGNSESEAESNLKSKNRKTVCECEVSGLVYGRDYSLGDTVRVQFELCGYKYCGKRRINGVKIWFEGDKCGEMPVFED